jgi:glutathione synthase/RimK-type ligase-like ATP-grasp enzyme
MIKKILFIYIVLYLIAYFRLSKLEKLMLSSILKLYKANKNCITYKIYVKTIILLFILPFKIITDKYAFIKITEGVLYNMHNVDINLINETEDKLQMHYFFMKHNIPVPELYGYSDNNGNLKITKDIDPKMKYIIKPRYGCLGINIYKSKGDIILNNKSIKSNLIIQELLQDCFNNNCARHYRVITFYSGKVFTIIELSQSNNKIASNHANGGKGKIVYEVNPKLEILIRKIALLHKSLWSDIFSIGWDLMLNCNKIVNAYVLELNIGHSAIFSDVTPDKDIEEYISEAELFYKKILMI